MKLKLKQAAIVSLAAFIILITCFGVLLQGNVYAAEKQKKVLFISSYSLSYPTVSQQIAGIKEGLDEDVYIYYEFMDGKTISDDAYIDKFYDYIYYKYSHISGVDAVIVGDDNALQMVLRYYNGVFKDVPVVYEAVNSRTRAELANSLGIPGILEPCTVDENIQTALKNNPSANRIMVISDDSNTGRALTSHAKALQNKYVSIPIEIVDASLLTKKEICSKIAASDANTVLLYASFNNDKNGKNYTNEEAMDMVLEYANAPVYSLVWLGRGSIGGVEADFKEMGIEAGKLAGEFLDGKTVAEVSADASKMEQAPIIATFDSKVMKQYGISKKDMPDYAKYVNDNSHIRRYLGITFLLLIGVLILLILLKRSKNEAKVHIENESRLLKTSDRLRHEAERDGLTGLGNRRLFEREISRCIAGDRSFALFIMDIDDFKKINDTYGHPFGDFVLKKTAGILNSVGGRSFVPYRYGGDEFALMFFSDERSELERAGQEIADLFALPVETDNGEFWIKVSIGGAMFPYDAGNADEVVERADKALYHVKKECKGGLIMYSQI
mgnify:CR=1 FL=1